MQWLLVQGRRNLDAKYARIVSKVVRKMFYDCCASVVGFGNENRSMRQ